MPFSVTYDKETDCIFVTVEGNLNLSLLDRMAAEVSRYIDEYGCRRILNDLRHAKLVEPTIDIYSMPNHALKAGVTRSAQRALVVNGTFSEFRFLETVFINRGNIVRLFNNIDDARRWLSSEKEDT